MKELIEEKRKELEQLSAEPTEEGKENNNNSELEEL